MTIRKKIVLTAAAAAVLSLSGPAFAGGFQLNEQSITGLGRAFAGEGIMGDDLSATWYNPAGMTLLSGTQVQLGGVENAMDMSYKGTDGSTENGRKRISPILHQMVTHQFNDKIWGGLAIVMPFGLADSYNQNWEGAERGYDAKLLTININPSVAWKINDKFSVGAGFSAQYIDATVSMKRNLLGQNVYSRLDADDWGYGWNIGGMWSATDNFRMGFGYRSAITHKAHGTVKLTTDAAGQKAIVAAAQNAKLNPGSTQAASMIAAMRQANLSFADVMGIAQSGAMTLNGGAQMDAPANANLTFVWKYSPKMRLSGSIRWTDWSSFDNLIINAGGLPHSQTDVPMKWRDSWFFSLGYDLDITPKWTIRGGVAYDRPPISNPRYRTALIPDANRIWATLGATYRMNEHWQFDIAATHIHGIGERNLYASQDANSQKIGRFDKLNCYMVGAGVVYRF